MIIKLQKKNTHLHIKFFHYAMYDALSEYEWKCACMLVWQAYHPEEPDHVFPVGIVEWHMTFHHLGQRVDVLPRFPTIFVSKSTVMQWPNNIDLTDHSPHQLN